MSEQNKPDYKFESDYWGNCVNTIDEDLKQFLYANAMGISKSMNLNITVGGKKILDIGGGPTSIIIKDKRSWWIKSRGSYKISTMDC